MEHHTPAAMLRRLTDATNQHDVAAIMDCFAEDYVNETPAHPARGFTGREQVRKNWAHIFDAVPDLEAQVLRYTEDGECVWSEWEMRGTRRDGSAHLMRGVILFIVRGGRASSARFYLEPVDHAAQNADAAVRALTAPTP
jgi:ketosteroid isomerase-like protein